GAEGVEPHRVVREARAAGDDLGEVRCPQLLVGLVRDLDLGAGAVDERSGLALVETVAVVSERLVQALRVVGHELPGLPRPQSAAFVRGDVRSAGFGYRHARTPAEQESGAQGRGRDRA